MTSNTEIVLKLKGPLLNYKSEEFKDLSSLNLTQQQINQSTKKQLLEMAPHTKFGDILTEMIMGNIKPKDGNESVKFTRWSVKINNKMITDKGELHLDENELKELIDIFTKNMINVDNSVVLGVIIYRLQQKEVELNGKLNTKK